MEIDILQQHQQEIRMKVKQNINKTADKMIHRQQSKGSSKYKYQIGDEVLLLIDLNNTKKSISKRSKLSSPYLPVPAKITAISYNNRYTLQMSDGSPVPHKRNTFTSAHFVLYRACTTNSSVRQSITKTGEFL
jgi:hypothetical protein